MTPDTTPDTPLATPEGGQLDHALACLWRETTVARRSLYELISLATECGHDAFTHTAREALAALEHLRRIEAYAEERRRQLRCKPGCDEQGVPF